jgi:hypothetical protein
VTQARSLVKPCVPSPLLTHQAALFGYELLLLDVTRPDGQLLRTHK